MTEHRLEGLRLYDTMTGAVREFTPVRPGHASIYLCGATVQGLCVERTLVGRRAQIKAAPRVLNVGDDDALEL